MNDEHEQLTRRMQDAATAAARSARDPVAHRAIWVSVAVLALLVAGLLWSNLSRSSEIDALRQGQQTAAEAAQQLYDQVRALGGTPAVQPPVPGERGEQGEPGPQGERGRDGRDGVDGQSPPCLAEPGQCRGADGTGVPGPVGPPGPPGADGVDGRDGVDGTPGQDGVDGRPPAGWTWVDHTGRTQSCARDAGSPDSAPTYTCTAAPPPGGPPGTTTNPLLPLGR